MDVAPASPERWHVPEPPGTLFGAWSSKKPMRGPSPPTVGLIEVIRSMRTEQSELIYFTSCLLTPRMGSKGFTCSFRESENLRPASRAGGEDKSLLLFARLIFSSLHLNGSMFRLVLSWLIPQHLQKSQIVGEEDAPASPETPVVLCRLNT